MGIEKVRRPPAGIEVRNRDEYGITDRALNAKFDDGKTMAVTHVLRHSADARSSANCTLFNDYVQGASSVEKQLVRPCPPGEVVFQDPKLAVANSWQALDVLRDDMRRRIADRAAAVASAAEVARDAAAKGLVLPPRPDNEGAYTHLVVVVMGWNTVQEEAVRNINSLVWNLGRAHDERVAQVSPGSPPAVEPRFNPLVIGVTWPSQWSSKWIDPAIKIVSFPTKAGDADEVGLSWLGVLLHDTLPAVRKGIDLPVVVLGHSFGAKATSVATCAGPAVLRPGASSLVPLGAGPVVDVLVNLEPAYLSERVFGRSSRLLQNVVYPVGCLQAKKFVITASAGDEAVPLPFWGTYLGEEKSYRKFCAADLDATDKVVANCVVADASGRNLKSTRSTASTVYYVDATNLISDNAYETGGGSHSDIYRLEHGRLVYAAMTGEGLWAGR